jgi:hypothetical protein
VTDDFAIKINVGDGMSGDRRVFHGVWCAQNAFRQEIFRPRLRRLLGQDRKIRQHHVETYHKNHDGDSDGFGPTPWGQVHVTGVALHPG